MSYKKYFQEVAHNATPSPLLPTTTHSRPRAKSSNCTPGHAQNSFETLPNAAVITARFRKELYGVYNNSFNKPVKDVLKRENACIFTAHQHNYLTRIGTTFITAKFD
ncbi:hypothetical protein J6590_087095 [Homalodisca vitripennis]|nr:hypothetical protein J6590_087095 [Homalodisca vitripennis]